jgi:hypothetical protein
MAFSTPLSIVFLFYFLIVGSNGNGAGEAWPDVFGDRIFYFGNNSFIGNITRSIAAQVTFQGFDFTGDPALAGSGISKDEWAWVVDVSDVEAGNHSVVSQTTHRLRFPQETFPPRDETNWTACMYIFTNDFAQNLTSGVKTNNGSCTGIFGQACLAAFINGTQANSLDRPNYPPDFSCPFPPGWEQLPECEAQFGTDFNTQPQLLYGGKLPAFIYFPLPIC